MSIDVQTGLDRFDNCLRCGLPQSHESHVSTPAPKYGWHPFHGQEYLDALEDALLFVREKNQLHTWKSTGIIIDTAPSFPEKVCVVCGEINWGGMEGGICFGIHKAVIALNRAHNRRASQLGAVRE